MENTQICELTKSFWLAEIRQICLFTDSPSDFLNSGPILWFPLNSGPNRWFSLDSTLVLTSSGFHLFFHWRQCALHNTWPKISTRKGILPACQRKDVHYRSWIFSLSLYPMLYLLFSTSDNLLCNLRTYILSAQARWRISRSQALISTKRKRERALGCTTQTEEAPSGTEKSGERGRYTKYK